MGLAITQTPLKLEDRTATAPSSIPTDKMQQQSAWLRAKYAGPGRVHSRHPELYPLATCVGIAIVLFGFYNTWDLTENPEMNLRRHRRETPVWERFQPQEGERYAAHRAPLAHLHANPVNRAATSIDDEKVWGKQRNQHDD